MNRVAGGWWHATPTGLLDCDVARGAGSVKIATFNVNNINKRLPNLIAWLKSSKPDIVCLQELKADRADFPELALRKAGYSAAWVGQRTWNGVAILSRHSEIVVTRRKLPGDAKDVQSRYLEAVIDGIIVVCLYAPNGNPRPGPKFDYKLAWLRRFNRHAVTLRKAGAPVVLAGSGSLPAVDDPHRRRILLAIIIAIQGFSVRAAAICTIEQRHGRPELRIVG